MREGGDLVSKWVDFYTVSGAAAASLLGLLFVAVSINAAETLGPAAGNSGRFAEQAFQNYLATLVISLLSLMPEIPATILGRTLVAVTLSWAFWACIRFYRSVQSIGDQEYSFTALRRHVASVAAFAMLLYAASCMSWGDDTHRYLIAAALIILLSSATFVSWELLLAVARTRQREEQGES
jgi:hypothetical protein